MRCRRCRGSRRFCGSKPRSSRRGPPAFRWQSVASRSGRSRCRWAQLAAHGRLAAPAGPGFFLPFPAAPRVKQRPAAAPAAAAPVDDDMAELMKARRRRRPHRAGRAARRAAEAKLAPAFRALGRGYFKIGQLDGGLRAYRAGGQLDPKLGDSNDVLADLRRGLADQGQRAAHARSRQRPRRRRRRLLYDVYDDQSHQQCDSFQAGQGPARQRQRAGPRQRGAQGRARAARSQEGQLHGREEALAARARERRRSRLRNP